MKNKPYSFFTRFFQAFAALLWLLPAASAQTQPTKQNLYGAPVDTSAKKTNTGEWESENAQIYYTRPFSTVKRYIDTSIHTIHRRPYSQPWYRDLGNLGSPSMNLMFTPQNPVGLSLGYHTFDALRYKMDSLNYFNTTRPYSTFVYNLGSKLEQTAQIFHTQNIKPYWNVAFNYRKTNTPGYYLTQRNNHD
ncbi:MAG TPA: putative porin, partial [Chitinophagaceae bacterium]|nr:putative porin [Chitinophagaceae bacterium]